MMRWAIAAGVLFGVAYTLSPLGTLCAAGLVLVIRWAAHDAPPLERRWVHTLLVIAVALRVLAVVGVFAIADHHQAPFRTIFGDEEYFLRRSMWMRNIAVGTPVSAADFIYAYEDLGRTSYLYVLAFLNVLFGPAPYGAHMVGALFYLAGAVVLYRAVRPRFGWPASLLGLALLLFLPSLFAWSVSALKEPLFFFVMTLEFTAAATLLRTRRPVRMIAAAIAVVVLAVAAQSVRDAGIVLAAGGLAVGVVLACLLRYPRVAVAALVAAFVLVPAALARNRVQDRIVGALHAPAMVNWGHVNTPGYVYKTLSPYIYEDRGYVLAMTPQLTAQYIVRSLAAYVVVPAPWQAQSRSALLFLPEQTVWYVLFALAPIGLFAGLRRDVTLASLLFGFATVAVGVVALSTGNIGTLVRHRGLALPYIVWLSAVGACDLAARGCKDSDVDH